MALFLRAQPKQIGTSMFYVVQDKDQLILGDQRYGYKMLMYLLCTVPTELWARLARLDITCPLALWNPPTQLKKKRGSVCCLLWREDLSKWISLRNDRHSTMRSSQKRHIQLLSLPEVVWKWQNRKTEIKATANNKPICRTFINFSINTLLTPHNFK